MSFRWRIFGTLSAAAILPMLLLGLGVRREMNERLTAEYHQRVDALVRVVQQDIERQSARLAEQLAALAAILPEDDRFRLGALGDDPAERRYALDYAGSMIRATGLSMLQIQDAQDRIVSSGHFRNEYGRRDPGVVPALARARGRTALVHVRSPDGPFLALARADSTRLGDRPFHLVGGVRVDEPFLRRLTRGDDLALALVYPGGALGTETGTSSEGKGQTIVAELAIPFIERAVDGETRIRPARLRVTGSLAALTALRARTDLWFYTALGIASILVLLATAWLSARITRPIAELARRAERLDVGTLDLEFGSERRDEVGTLARSLDRMTRRLRASLASLREAERRATIGDLARQVNHDVKNAVVPIRNVVRHLAEVARDRPDRLAPIFREREHTLESGIRYLEDLAANYARLRPVAEPARIDVAALVRDAVRDRSDGAGVDLRCEVEGELPPILADPVAVRRVLDNLIANAIESLDGDDRRVTVRAEAEGAVDPSHVRITVSDSGRGLDETERARIFEDFYTTREGGTGLGLSIVRRLVSDLGGTVRIESEPGRGSRFMIELPTAGWARTRVAEQAEP